MTSGIGSSRNPNTQRQYQLGRTLSRRQPNVPSDSSSESSVSLSESEDDLLKKMKEKGMNFLKGIAPTAVGGVAELAIKKATQADMKVKEEKLKEIVQQIRTFVPSWTAAVGTPQSEDKIKQEKNALTDENYEGYKQLREEYDGLRDNLAEERTGVKNSKAIATLVTMIGMGIKTEKESIDKEMDGFLQNKDAEAEKAALRQALQTAHQVLARNGINVPSADRRLAQG